MNSEFGEVEIQNEGLVKFLEAANELQIEGLLQKGGVNKRSGMEKVLEISTEKEKLDLLTQQKYVLGIPIKDEPFFESKVPNSEEQEMRVFLLEKMGWQGTVKMRYLPCK